MYAEKKLIESFKSLVETTPVDKITIKEITDGAGVIRSTFYYHFQDKYDLIERIFKREVLAPLMPLLENNMITEMTLLIFKNLEKEKKFYRKLSHMEGQNSFGEIVQRSIQEALLTYMEENIAEESRVVLKKHFGWLGLDQIANYYASTMTFVVLNWIQTEMDVTPEEVTKVADMIFKLSLKDVIDIIRTGDLEIGNLSL
jgi:AcrR family transcriptional regulator